MPIRLSRFEMPKRLIRDESTATPTYARFTAEPLETGYGHTIGNALRRVGDAKPISTRAQPAYALPDHLPKRLAISMFIWNYIAMAAPREPYDDLEKAVAGLPERGFNAVRVEAGLNWCFHTDGRPRGELEFGSLFPVYRQNLIGVGKGGARVDVLQRVIKLMALARK